MPNNLSTIPHPPSRPLRRFQGIPGLDQGARRKAPAFQALALTALVVAFAAPPTGSAAETVPPPRQRLLLDFGWKFHLGNSWGIAQNLGKAGTGSGPASPSFSDASWRPVDLPHDWAIELPFDPKADGSHGFRALGRDYPDNSVGWYRRTFDLPSEDAGRRIWLEFDGVFRDTVVFVNGWCVGRHESGYSSFRFDITDLVNCGGSNLIAVKVDATQTEGWFYEGAGIYRHAWLVKTGPLAVAPDGVFVSTAFKGNTPSGAARVRIETRLVNLQSNAAKVTARYQILDASKTVVATAAQSAALSGASEQTLESSTAVAQPALWSPENPVLYTLITTIEAKGKALDRVETEFGIRTVAFDAAKGFLLNGRPYVLKGTCNHQDHAGVGAALPDSLQYFRIRRLKEMGCNAYRTSHNPPTPELLQVCDRLGLLVMDENRLLGSDARNRDRLERLLRRDRNHPSVAIWSVANEEFSVQSTPAGGRVAKTMQDLIRRLDPTRPVTYPAPQGNDFSGINGVIEVRGWNYRVGSAMDDYHKAHPAQPNVGTEQGSTVSTRGIYANDTARGYVSAYDDNAPEWAHTAETWWSYFSPRPWLAGGFVWTGFDYRGEPTPYSWPCINSHFGILDTCGFPKDNFWYYQSWWTSNPVLHLLPHWNWPGKEGREIDVRALSNCEEVELFLNGRSQGRRPIKRDSDARWKVKYAPGTLSAKGYKAGLAVAADTVETTGAPAAIRLTPDRSALRADGEDAGVFTVAVVDAKGRTVPTASNLIHFELDGPARILGVGNGDPSCHQADVFLPSWPTHSRPIAGWKWKAIKDPYRADLPEVGIDFDDSAWAAWDANAESGPLGHNQNGVFRCRFSVSEEDLAANALEAGFNRIDGESSVYLNGRKIGESHDRESVAVFDLKPFLHSGQNTLALTVASYSDAAGLNKGTALRLQEKAILPTWERSVFNGLGQIIIRTGKEADVIRLRARAEGLTEATVAIQAQTSPLRPAAP